MRMTRLADIMRVFEKMLSTLKKNIAVLGERVSAFGSKRVLAAALAVVLVLTISIGTLVSVKHNRALAQLNLQKQADVASNQAQAAPSERDRQATVSRGTARPAAPPDNGGPPPGFTWADVTLLAHLIFAEANGEPYSGQVAVGAVVLNRTRSGEFPSTVAGVVYQPGQYESVGNYYFNSEPGQTAINAALDAMHGWDPSGGAIYFFDPSKVTNGFLWNRPLTVSIGGHRFTK